MGPRPPEFPCPFGPSSIMRVKGRQKRVKAFTRETEGYGRTDGLIAPKFKKTPK